MNVRRRSGNMNTVVGSKVKNAVNNRVDADTQARPIKNAVSSPKAAGVSKINGATSGPS